MIGWIVLLVFVLLLAGLLGFMIMVYNGLIQLRNNIDRDWSNIDVMLKQRFDELPKLIKVCEGYMQHEERTLKAVTQARSMVAGARSDKEKIQAQNVLTDTLRSLFAVAENYPDLKADTAFRQLGYRISELEDQIADRREFFNEAVNLYNIRIEQFPEMFIARTFNFRERPLWHIKPEERRDVEVNFQPA